MLREGSGMVAPRPVKVTLSSAQLRYLRALADDRDRRRNYGARPDRYGRGLAPHATLKGLVGEQAFANYANDALGLLPPLMVDEEDRPGGDGGVDFNLFGILIQVKTRTIRDAVLYRRETGGGRVLPIRWHVLVSASFYPPPPRAGPLPSLSPDPFVGKQEVLLDGWLDRTAILDHSTAKGARVGSHRNLEFTDVYLEPMSDLLLHIQNVRDAGGMP